MMNNVNKTLYIPLYGKSFVSRKGLFIKDIKAEEIWEKEQFPLKGKSKSKWLAYYMGIRAAVFDDWLREQLKKWEDAVVIHIGCGMDSRVLRVGTEKHTWFDVDFPEVIEERKLYFTETSSYRMIAGDVTKGEWMEQLEDCQDKKAIVLMEGVSMYLSCNETVNLLTALNKHFKEIFLLMDSYTELAAKMSKYRNPINDVGVTKVYGMDNPKILEFDGFSFVKEHSMTPGKYINELTGLEKMIFEKLYAGKMAGKLYRMYEFRTM